MEQKVFSFGCTLGVSGIKVEKKMINEILLHNSHAFVAKVLKTILIVSEKVCKIFVFYKKIQNKNAVS
jgi:hypothetical protein